MQKENLKEDVLLNLRNLNQRQNELIILVGQLHLEIREADKQLNSAENEFDMITNEFERILNGLKEQYPNGEIDLVDGTVSFEK
jgi:predicted  nucleic acid-binding Zn-ribbon protein